MNIFTIAGLAASVAIAGSATAAQPSTVAVFISRMLMNDPAGAADMVAEPVKQLAGHETVAGQGAISRAEFTNAIRGCEVVRLLRPSQERPDLPPHNYYEVSLRCGDLGKSFRAEPVGEQILVSDFEQYG